MSIMRKPTLMEFINYEIVRRDGHYNMIMECGYAADAAGLGMPEYLNVLNNYEWCREEWLNKKFKLKQIIHKDDTIYETYMKDILGKDMIYNFNEVLDEYQELSTDSSNAEYVVEII